MAGGKAATTALTHPRDRRVRQLERRGKREERLAAQKQRLRARDDALHLRFLWFREQCRALLLAQPPQADDDDDDVWRRPSPLLTRLLARAYVARHDEELQALLARGRDAPHGRVRQLQALRQADEDALYSARGLDVPRLASDDDVAALTTRWDGHRATLQASDVPRACVALTRRRRRGDKQHKIDTDEERQVATLLAQLQRQHRLVPLDEVSAQAAHVLPRRLRLKEQTRQQTAADAAAATRRRSVKHTSATAHDVRARAHARGVARQQQRQHAQRHAALQRARDVDSESDDDDDDQVL